MESTDYTLNTIASQLEERTVCKRTAEGRDVLLAHTNMVDITKRPDRRKAEFHTLEGLLDFARLHGSEKDSILFYDKSKVVLFLDEKWRENPSEFTIRKSSALLRWINLPGQKNAIFDQESLIDHLECWTDEIQTIYPAQGEGAVGIPIIINALMTLSLRAKISYDRKFQDRNNQTLQFQIAEENGDNPEQKAIPKNWVLKIPVLEGAQPQEVQVRLAYHVPRHPGEQPYFFFECPKLESYVESSIDGLGEVITGRLANFPVFKATPKQ